MERTYQVTYARDYLDPNPTVKVFDDFDEMQNYVTQEVSNRVSQVPEEDRTSQEEIEYTLLTIKEV